MPLIYMGDEFAQANDDNYQQTAAHAHDSRWLHRPYWNQDANQACSDTNNFAATTYSRLCEMLSWRRQLPQLAAHEPRRLLTCDHPALFAFLRGDTQQAFLFLGNFSAVSVTLKLSDLLFNEVNPSRVWFRVQNRTIVEQQLTLPAWSQLWLTTTLAGGTQA
jgi:amylosucrase